MNILYLFIPVIAFLTLWVPVVRHYHAPNIPITKEIIDKARNMPEDPVLDEIEGFFERTIDVDKEKLIMKAEKIQKGEYALCPPNNVAIPFNPDDLDKGLPGCGLTLASLKIPEILINAYEVSGRDDFLMTARDIITAWASYERSAWLPKGLLWNDHAISERIYVLVRFWKYYRHSKVFDPEVAKDIFQFVERSGEMLSKPSHFTFNTNHGIMQNLALWRICIAFPSLPNVEIYKNVALQRMNDQMSYYVNDDGVILEHSAGYQRAGLEFMSMAFRYLTLLNTKIPETWISKYEKAKKVYAYLRRPDGSLPMFGDTNDSLDSLGPRVTFISEDGRSEAPDNEINWRPRQSYTLYPVAGYSIWWDGLESWPDERKLNQTVVVWSYFPGQAHKHADEMSVLLYAGGQTWWTNAGYWTYGTEGRSEAVSWSGSNAPHLVGELMNSSRKTELKYHGKTERLAVIDLERNGPDLYRSRRQVVHYKPDVWIVIDSTSGDKNSMTRTIWTTPIDIILNEGKYPDSFYLRKDGKNLSLESFFITSHRARINHYKGSLQPFAGWVKNEPADALVIEQPANNSWSAAIWSLGSPTASSIHVNGKPYMQNWVGPESWEIVLPQQTGQMNIGRDGNRVYVNEGGETDSIQEVKLKGAPDGIADNYNAIRSAYKNAANKYPKFTVNMPLRWKMTYVLIFIFVIQEVFFIFYKKKKGIHYTGLRIIAMIGWLSITALWQVIVYLKG